MSALRIGRLPKQLNVAAHGTLRTYALAAASGTWQDGDAVFCHITLDTDRLFF